MTSKTNRHPTELRRQQIADAALKVIAEQGLGRFTTQAIAAEVGITDGTLFRHFANKEAIVLEALDRVEEQIFAGFPYQDADPMARIERFFRFRSSLLLANPLIARLAFSDELGHAAGEQGMAKIQSWKQRSFDFLVAAISEASGDSGVGSNEIAILVVGALIAQVQLGTSLSLVSIDKTWNIVHKTLIFLTQSPTHS